MAQTIFYIDEIDNTGTLYEEVIKVLYSEDEWNTMLVNTKFLRNNILKLIKDFIAREDIITIKEFCTSPLMTYSVETPIIVVDDDMNSINISAEVSTDFVIIPKAFNMEKIDSENEKIDDRFFLVLEALDTNNVTVNSWNEFLDSIFLKYSGKNVYNPRVQKIVIEDACTVLKKWKDLNNTTIKTMLKAYNQSQGISTYDHTTFWLEPLTAITKKYWDKFSFVMTINDYDIYNEENDDLLAVISEKYFNVGYFDEIVICINYFYWFDDFQKIIDWTEKNLKSSLVSYRFNTLFTNNSKHRYYDENEAMLFGDIQRYNTVEEELEMFETRLPILLSKMLTNPQTYGVELNDGYFGKEGEIPNLNISYENFEMYKDIMKKSLQLSPFAQTNDYFKITFENPKKQFFFCIKN